MSLSRSRVRKHLAQFRPHDLYVEGGGWAAHGPFLKKLNDATIPAQIRIPKKIWSGKHVRQYTFLVPGYKEIYHIFMHLKYALLTVINTLRCLLWEWIVRPQS